MQYPLLKNQGYFWTGADQDNRQILIASTVTDIYLLSFDANGKYLGLEKVPVQHPPERFPSSRIYRTDATFHRRLEEQMDAIKLQRGWHPADILIEPFEDLDISAGIEPLPAEYQELLEAPETMDDEDRGSLEAALARWRSRGWFVFLFWGIEYWMSAEGKVMSHT